MASKTSYSVDTSNRNHPSIYREKMGMFPNLCNTYLWGFVL